MAGGANKKFLDERERFLRANLIEVQVNDQELTKVAADHVDATKAVRAQIGRQPNQGQAVGVDVATKAAGIYDFDLEKLPTKAEVQFGARTTRVPMYALKAWGSKKRDQQLQVTGDKFAVKYKKPKHAHTLSAYWLPWSENSSWSVQLGADADFFFTATMDGCSLAISSGATPIVTHANYKSPDNPGVASEELTRERIDQQHAALGVDVSRTLMKSRYAARAVLKERGINKMVTVVGFRNTATGVWSFYWQRRKVIYGDAKAGTHTRILLTDRLVPIV